MVTKSIIARASGGGDDFEPAPEGVFLARCYRMVDVGTQTITGQYGTSDQRTVYLFWELLKTADGGEVKDSRGDAFEKPPIVMNNYKISMHPKSNLRKHIDAWRGKKLTEDEAAEFDIAKLLDKVCLLQVQHSKSKDGTKTYANVQGIMPSSASVKGVNEATMFTVSDPDMDEFDKLPQFLKNKIQDSPEFDNDGNIDPQNFPEDDGDQTNAKAEEKVKGSELPF